ncbi:unnamed protein product [Laminaria digitata]
MMPRLGCRPWWRCFRTRNAAYPPPVLVGAVVVLVARDGGWSQGAGKACTRTTSDSLFPGRPRSCSKSRTFTPFPTMRGEIPGSACPTTTPGPWPRSKPFLLLSTPTSGATTPQRSTGAQLPPLPLPPPPRATPATFPRLLHLSQRRWMQLPGLGARARRPKGISPLCEAARDGPERDGTGRLVAAWPP